MEMTRLEFLAVMKSILILLKKGETASTITLIEELIEEAKK